MQLLDHRVDKNYQIFFGIRANDQTDDPMIGIFENLFPIDAAGGGLRSGSFFRRRQRKSSWNVLED
jgi:hypothetical protein